MIRQKGRVNAVDNDGIFASPDHMPTILDLLELPIPETCEGYSHVKGMFGEDESEPQDMLICSYPGGAELVKSFSDKGLTHKAYGWRGIKDKRYTYVIFNGYAPGEEQKEYLYDNKEDPYQKNPELLESDCQRAEVLAYREKLKNYLCQTEDPFLWERQDKI